MIRVAFIVHSMQVGGIERSITRIISGLDKSQFLPTVFCLDRTGPAARWLPEGVKVVEIKKNPGNDMGAIFRLARQLRKERIDLVQSHNWGTLVETLLARRLAGVPAHIHAERGTVLGMTKSGGLKFRMRAAAMRCSLATATRVISNANSVAKRVEEGCGYPAKKIAIIPNGVASFPAANREQTRTAVRKRLGIDSEALLIGSVGRLHEVKGFDVLIGSFQRVAGELPIQLVLVGEGEQRERLESIIEEKGVRGRVHLAGHHNEIGDWLFAMDAYVNSSRSEGMSQSIVEAMSVGLPIIATDVGDSKQMIKRPNLTCGEVCSPDQDTSLAAAIKKLMSNKQLIKQYGANASKCHQQFYSESTFIHSIQNIYFEAMGKQPLPGSRQTSPYACSGPDSVTTETVDTDRASRILMNHQLQRVPNRRGMR